MLNKLLKYDLKWCYKPLLVFYILAIFFSIVVRIVESFEQSLILLIIDKVCCGVLIATMISILINCFMRNWARFVRNIYKDESYLTHTLPVSKNQIYLSKVLTVIITMLTSLIVIIICLAISCLNKDTWFILKQSFEQSAVYFNSSVFSLVFVMIITIFFEILFMMMCGILGIIIGHKSNNLKIVKSIFTGFVTYMILSFLSLIVLFVVGLFNSDIMSIFNNIEVSSNALKGMMLVAILVYAIYNLGIYFLGNKLLNKGVNVD
jgi:hypothetical protein